MVFHTSLGDIKSPQVSKTLLNILADLNNAVVWITSALSPISNSSCPFTKPLGTIPSAPIPIGITVTLIFHSFFISLVRSKCLSLFEWSTETTKSTFFLLLIITVIYWPSARPNMPFQSDAPKGSDTSQWPVIERNRVGRFGWRNVTR